MRILILTISIAGLLSGCSVPHPGSGFAPGLLTHEAMRKIDDSTDPTEDAGPWYALSRTELIALLGDPHEIEPHLENGKQFAESLHYVQDYGKFSFMFEGDMMIAMQRGGIPKFSDPSFTEESYVLTNPFHDIIASNVAYVAFSGGVLAGPYFVTRDRTEIVALLKAARALNAELSFGSACGFLANASFCDRYGNAIASFGVHASGSPIYVGEPNNFLDKSISSRSVELKDMTFDLMMKYCPDVLLLIMKLDSKCVQEHLIPNWPFERVKERTSNKDLQLTK